MSEISVNKIQSFLQEADIERYGSQWLTMYLCWFKWNCQWKYHSRTNTL